MKHKPFLLALALMSLAQTMLATSLAQAQTQAQAGPATLPAAAPAGPHRLRPAGQTPPAAVPQAAAPQTRPQAAPSAPAAPVEALEAPAKRARLMRNDQTGLCMIQTPTLTPKLGVSKDDLVKFANLTEQHKSLVNQVLRLNKLEGYQELKEIRCDEAAKVLVTTLNRDLYSKPATEKPKVSPILRCEAGDYRMRFQVNEDRLVMELTKVEAGQTEAKVISRDEMSIVDNVTSNAPPICLTPKKAQQNLTFKLCIPVKPKNEEGEGRLQLDIDKKPIPPEMRAAKCVNPPGFGRAVKPLVKVIETEESAPRRDAPKSQTPARTTTQAPQAPSKSVPVAAAR